MRHNHLLHFAALAFFGLLAQGQGTFIYDQQSADESAGGGGIGPIQPYEPIGQSFTPTLASVGFIRLFLADHTPGNSLGATVYVNLRSNSITGDILGVTDPVFMPDGFGIGFRGFTNFIFAAPVSVVPGVTYYFQPIVQSGDTWDMIAYHYNYAGGTAFYQGTADSLEDLWFREGMVPEPTSAVLVLLGFGFFSLVRRKRDG